MIGQARHAIATTPLAWLGLVTGALALAACQPCPAAQAGADARPMRFTGTISRDDPPDAKLKHPCKVHEVQLAAGQAVVIRLTSKAFDAYLIVRDAQGKELAFNNNDSDDPPTLNARLVFVAPKQGTYRLIATSRPTHLICRGQPRGRLPPGKSMFSLY